VERTQIYLTDKERKALRLIAQRLGTTQSEVIRTAVDRFIERESADDKLRLLRAARGLWKDRQDLPDFATLRQEFDRAG
jgi:hypothetical protein